MNAPTAAFSRRDIYYWKCDREVPFQGISRCPEDTNRLDSQRLLQEKLEMWLRSSVEVIPQSSHGDHLTFVVRAGNKTYFARIDDGPEGDRQFETESHLLGALRALGVPVAKVLFVDVSRSDCPFSIQVLEYVPGHDLSLLQNESESRWEHIAVEIGRNVARWQSLTFDGFGPLVCRNASEGAPPIRGIHHAYEDYFFIRLEKHIAHLRHAEFLTSSESKLILSLFDTQRELARTPKGCLTHKDLALWNIMGDGQRISAFIDWDDAISGDPVDDLSLFACFHKGPALRHLIDGYRDIRSLPANFSHRFWFHLLRNLIVKSVIRCQAGYFLPRSKAFLLPAGMDGPAFQTATKSRLLEAMRGLSKDLPLRFS